MHAARCSVLKRFGRSRLPDGFPNQRIGDSSSYRKSNSGTVCSCLHTAHLQQEQSWTTSTMGKILISLELSKMGPANDARCHLPLPRTCWRALVCPASCRACQKFGLSRTTSSAPSARCPGAHGKSLGNQHATPARSSGITLCQRNTTHSQESQSTWIPTTNDDFYIRAAGRKLPLRYISFRSFALIFPAAEKTVCIGGCVSMGHSIPPLVDIGAQAIQNLPPHPTCQQQASLTNVRRSTAS